MDNSDPAVAPVHAAVKGRARLRIAALRTRPDLKGVIEAALLSDRSILSATASTVTMTLLVQYDPRRELEDVIGVVRVAVRAAVGTPQPKPSWRQPRKQAAREERPTGIVAFFRELAASVARKRRAGPEHTPSAAELLRYAAPESPAQPWHTVPGDRALEFWRTNRASGLTANEVGRRLGRYGPNVLVHPDPRSAISIFFGQFNSLPVFLLFGSAALSLATGGIADAIAIGFVLMFNASIGAASEFDAERTIRSLLSLSEPIATVLRDGRLEQIGGEDVVPGDLLVLARGTQVAADARLLEAEDLSVDESSLTGESVPVEKTAVSLSRAGVPLAERVNLVFRGTVATGGSGLAVVCATGRHTEIGRIQELIASSQQPATPLQRQMDRLGNQLLWITAGVSGAVFVAGLLRGSSLLNMIRTATSLAVAAIPEGLPTIATVSLASAVRNLLQEQIVVRRLEAIESLGAVDVVCFDKTGTLTLNRMSAVAAFCGMHRIDISGGKFFRDLKPVAIASHPELIRLMEICALCSRVTVNPETGKVEGSGTETALVQMGLSAGINLEALRASRPLLALRSRAAGRNYMMTTHGAGRNMRLVAVKGAPSEVLRLCTRHMRHGQLTALEESDRKAILAENDQMASGSGLRVLGAAWAEFPENAEPDGLTWCGLVGIADPPRHGLRELIGAFRNAGIRAVMITGDQGGTARAVARALDLHDAGSLEAMDAASLEALTGDELARKMATAHVFSRVDPAQKLRIVQAFQRAGATVAMTGDGINDGPALKAADVGITLGESGTRVAREISDIVLTADNIHALLPALREGRRVHDNLRKAVRFMAATNLGEVLLSFTALTAGMGQPLNARQLLWINVMTDVFPELALAIGPASGDLMSRPPCAAAEQLLGRGDYGSVISQSAVMSAAGLAAYIAGISRYGISPQAGAMAFLTLTSAQLLHGASAQYRAGGSGPGKHAPQNPLMTMSIAGGFAALGLAQFGFPALLGSARIGPGAIAFCAAASTASFLFNDALLRAHPLERSNGHS